MTTRGDGFPRPRRFVNDTFGCATVACSMPLVLIEGRLFSRPISWRLLGHNRLQRRHNP
jgi:hypothetical protein